MLILNACRRSSYRTPSPTTKDSARSGRSGESSGPTGRKRGRLYERISRPLLPPSSVISAQSKSRDTRSRSMDGRVCVPEPPGEADIQIDLFYDYRTNVTNYLAWSAWLRLNQPPTCYWADDPSFLVAETAAISAICPARSTSSMPATCALQSQTDRKAVGISGRTLINSRARAIPRRPSIRR